MQLVILGLSITSSWGNGHATTYRSLVREIERLGHEVLFLERDKPWYAAHRDLPNPPYGATKLYQSLEELRDCYGQAINEADAVMVGSYVPEGKAVGEFVMEKAGGLKIFYDIDTPVTINAVEEGTCPYLNAALIGKYDLYLSFTGGPILSRLQNRYGSPMARPLYCSVDPELYCKKELEPRWDLGYLGTYSPDRQPAVDALLAEAARALPQGRFIVAGAQYPKDIEWPENVELVEHLAPVDHCQFYNQQRFTLNVTRQAMVAVGYSPSVRLFEAAACGIPVISDHWQGMVDFFQPGEEILIARSTAEVLGYLKNLDEDQRCEIGEKARARVLQEHTAAHRAATLEKYLFEAMKHENRRDGKNIAEYFPLMEDLGKMHVV